MSGVIMAAILSGGSATEPAEITLNNQTASDSASGVCDCWYQLNIDGHAYTINDDLTTEELEQWVDPDSAAAQFEARVTPLSGSISTVNGSDAVLVWLSLSSSRKWGVRQTTPGMSGPVVCAMTLEIRDSATETVRDSATIIVTAESI